LKTKPKRKRIISSVPRFKTKTLQSESENDSLHVHSKYTENVFETKVSQDSTFGVYEDDKGVLLK